jgi:arabinofuranosyltransferase
MIRRDLPDKTGDPAVVICGQEFMSKTHTGEPVGGAVPVAPRFWNRPVFWLVFGAVAIALAFPLLLVVHAHRVNGGVDGFPLDDPWIYLTYARNLHDAHTFSYFPGDPTTQGSTSPLYTALLALGFSFTHSEKVLSYVLGIIFQGAFLLAFAFWARRCLRGWIWAMLALLLIGLDSRVGILAVSGMETSLFLFLIALAFVARAGRRHWLTGAALGLAVWVRPDGLILTALFAADALWEKLLPDRARLEARPGTAAPADRGAPSGLPPWVKIVAMAGGLSFAYAIFNLTVGGKLLPNTFAAKTAYYSMQPRLPFLRRDVGDVFFTAGWRVLLPFALYAIISEGVLVAQRKRTALRREAAWAIALPLAYFCMLPFAHRFGRYLLPALPATVVLALSALQDLAGRLAGLGVKARDAKPRKTQGATPPIPASRAIGADAGGFVWTASTGLAAGALLLAALVLQVQAAARAGSLYGELCAYHWTRHERTGRWLESNTPRDAVIATHDVGAIAYYSKRRVVDIVGVVYPEAIRHLNQPGYLAYLNELFDRKGVTHLAVLRNWCEIVNIDPIFTADPKPEIMEVFPWITGRTHLMPRETSFLNQQAADALRQRNFPGAVAILRQSIALDDRSSRTWMLLAVTEEYAGKSVEAEEAYKRTLVLFPELHEARFRLASICARNGQRAEALDLLKELLERKPDFPGAQELLRRLSS